MKFCIKTILAVIFLTTLSSKVFAQGESPLRTYGYFQTQFFHYEEFMGNKAQNSFNSQQLNLFFQKNLSENWSAFTNVELTNSFSTNLNTGKIALEEAWGRYKKNDKFKLKIGLLIPTFNNLNSIKNRTPLLPYIDRPLAYESSMAALLPISKMVPGRAFVEAGGVLPAEKIDVDYAVYLGNSPGLIPNGSPSLTGGENVSGVDSTTTLLIGGRIGITYNDIKAGISGTFDKSGDYTAFGREKASRKRFGADASFDYKKLHVESEYISSSIDTDGLSMGPQIPLPVGMVSGAIEADYLFYYGSAGVNATDDLYVYVIYNRFDVNDKPTMYYEIKYPCIGFAYSPNYRVKFKAQVGRPTVTFSRPLEDKGTWNRYFVALSIFF